MCLPRVIAGVIPTVPRQLGTVSRAPFSVRLRLKIAPLETGRPSMFLIRFNYVFRATHQFRHVQSRSEAVCAVAR